MGRLFGTDGVRGVAGIDLTAQLAMDLAVAAFATASAPAWGFVRKKTDGGRDEYWQVNCIPISIYINDFRELTRDEVATALGVSVREMDNVDSDVQRASVVSLHALTPEAGAELVPTTDQGPEALLVHREQIGATALQQLRAHQQAKRHRQAREDQRGKAGGPARYPEQMRRRIGHESSLGYASQNGVGES